MWNSKSQFDRMEQRLWIWNESSRTKTRRTLSLDCVAVADLRMREVNVYTVPAWPAWRVDAGVTAPAGALINSLPLSSGLLVRILSSSWTLLYWIGRGRKETAKEGKMWGNKRVSDCNLLPFIILVGFFKEWQNLYIASPKISEVLTDHNIF
jgi:hypothetical protein